MKDSSCEIKSAHFGKASKRGKRRTRRPLSRGKHRTLVREGYHWGYSKMSSLRYSFISGDMLLTPRVIRREGLSP